MTPEGERMLAWAHRILAGSDGMRMDVVALRGRRCAALLDGGRTAAG